MDHRLRDDDRNRNKPNSVSQHSSKKRGKIEKKRIGKRGKIGGEAGWIMLHILVLALSRGRRRSLDAEAKRMLASTDQGGARGPVPRRPCGGPPRSDAQDLGRLLLRPGPQDLREQALRAPFHGDGFYHTLFDVAETLKDYAFLETEVKHAHACRPRVGPPACPRQKSGDHKLPE